MSSEAAVQACEIGQPPFQKGHLTHDLICGRARVHEAGKGWLMLLVPEVLIFRRSDLAGYRTWRIVEAIAAAGNGPGDEDTRVLDRLTEALFLSLLGKTSALEGGHGRLAMAARDPQVRKVLELMYAQSDRPWTIERLAGQAAMSRATLARRFRALLGVPVMGYLNEIRMARATQLLLEGSSLDVVARKTGYSSAEAFRKAFKKQTQVTPARFVRDATKGVAAR